MCTKAQNLVDDRLAKCHWVLVREKVNEGIVMTEVYYWP